MLEATHKRRFLVKSLFSATAGVGFELPWGGCVSSATIPTLAVPVTAWIVRETKDLDLRQILKFFSQIWAPNKQLHHLLATQV